MSYCRFSSDHGDCDVYVYQDTMGGWTTHVAGRKPKHLVPDRIRALSPEPGAEDWVERWMEYEHAKREWIRSLPHKSMPTVKPDPDNPGELIPGEPVVMFASSEYRSLSEIGGEAGQSFSDPTPGECADRLEALRAKGFVVPQYAIDELREEQGAL